MNKEAQLINSAKTSFNSNLYKKSLASLEEVLEINPNNSSAYFYMGNIFHIKGQLGKAIKAFNKVLELDPNNTDASISLSVILNDIGKYEQAQEVFNRANEKVKNGSSGISDPHINKQFASKHYELAEMYFSYNRYDESLFEYNKAIALNPDNLEIRIKIAKVYSKKGYVSKAIEELRSLKSEYPSFIQARVALGLLYYSSGNALEAQNEWQYALNKDPLNTELQMYLELSKSATETSLNLA